jgi:hypothetical protein
MNVGTAIFANLFAHYFLVPWRDTESALATSVPLWGKSADPAVSISTPVALCGTQRNTRRFCVKLSCGDGKA